STQTRPGAHWSLWFAVPESSASQGCWTPRTWPGASMLQVAAPVVFTEHFSLQPHPVWQNGSQAAASVGVQLGRASKHTSGGFSAGTSPGPSPTSDAGRSTPPSRLRQQVSVAGSHLNPSGHDLPTPASRLHRRPPSLMLGL